MGVPGYGFNQFFMDCLTSCNNLRIMYNSEFFKFCTRALQIENLTMLLSLICLQRYLRYVLQRLLELV